MDRILSIIIHLFLLNVYFKYCHSQGASSYDLLYRGIACEDRLVEYSCPQSYRIKILEVLYGRSDNVTCTTDIPANKTTDRFCDISDAEQIVKAKCDGKQSCNFKIDDETLTRNGSSCEDVHKHTNILYKCEAIMYNVKGCEGDKIQFSCPANEVIRIQHAMFGRMDDNETCHHESILNTSCMTTEPGYQVLSSLCNGRISCEFYAFSSVFGDPCPGTYKTVEVDYICGACRNTHDKNDCDQYESWGECSNNLNWMSANCRQSCWQCQYEGTCTNLHGSSETCDYWAQTGECYNNQNWMKQNCRNSCNSCKDLFIGNIVKTTSKVNFCESGMVNATCDTGFSLRIDEFRFGRWSLDTCQHSTVNESTPVCATPADTLSKTKAVCDGRNQCLLEARIDMYGDYCPGIHKQAEVVYTCQECRNVLLDSECEQRKTAGECSSNLNWMWDYCFRTCSLCDVRECGNQHDETADMPICDYWAVRGECTGQQASNTIKICRTSCNKCQDPVATTTVAGGSTSSTQTTSVMTTTPLPTSSPIDTPIFKETCEGNTVKMKCPSDFYLRVDSMFFGRLDNITCPHESVDTVNCTTPEGSLLRVRGVCNGRNTCYFPASHRALGDPCPGTYKAASILYECTACNNTASDKDCERWAEKGRCTSDYHNMIQQCFKTCSKCESKGCGNNHQSNADCDYWALRGECKKFPGFMLDNCKESCQSCTSTARVLPTVQHAICETQNIQLHCPENYHIQVESMFYGRVNNDTCPHENIFTSECFTPDGALEILKTLCDGRRKCYFEARSELWGDNCRTSYKAANVSFSCHYCRNTHLDAICEFWAKEGKCQSEASRMSEQCSLTCSGCLNKDCGNQNSNQLDCDYWALLSECQYNPAFMLNKCQESCNLCTAPPTTTPPISTTSPAPHPDKEPPRTVTLCEKQVQELVCSGDYYLRINSVFYGRKNEKTCPHVTANNTDCPSVDGIVNKARAVFDGRKNGWFEALSRVWGDSCPNTYKYGVTEYTCQLCRNIDSDADCKAKKAEGKCTSDYNSMMDKCFKTCTECDNSCSNSYSVSIDCDYWALIGECEKNRRFMLEKCEASCSVCPKPFNCSEVDDCTGNGKCIENNVCSCKYGWKGTKCETYFCADDNNCNGNGWCVGPNTCLCDTYYGGRDCGQCTVMFPPGPACLPCPRCQQGSCVASPKDRNISPQSYIGCFMDRNDIRDLPHLLTGPVAKSIDCVSRCHMIGYQYAGIQNGDKCYCGNSYGQYGSSNACNASCNLSGDKCGGVLANSLWRTYQGACQCEAGWSGPFCSQCVGDSCPTTVPQQTTVTLTLIIQMQWKDIYSDSAAAETVQLYSTLSSNLLNFYKNISTAVVAVVVKQLRSGSVIVEHDVTLRGDQNTYMQEHFQCLVYERVKSSGKIGPDMPVQIDTFMEQNCAWRMDYCKNGGTLVWVSNKWSCSCTTNYKGEKCEENTLDRTIMITVVVVACVVVLVFLVIIICVCARRSTLPKANTTTASPNGEAYSMHVADTTSLSKLKDQAELGFGSNEYT